MGVGAVPQLEGHALGAVRHRGSHLQIIAAAGSGKTEVVSQRVVDLIAGNASPDSIVAFTFTERAADELKARVQQRIEHRLGRAVVDRMNGCFIGTIHSYCFQLLRDHVPKYETYDILDENRLAAFLSRERDRIDLSTLEQKHFTALRNFTRNYEVVQNELIPHARLRLPFRKVVAQFDARLGAYRLLTYGGLIALAVEELQRGEVFTAVHSKLKYLIVDEYQDVNPAQEALIRRLAESPTELCIVGDDDQSIYQWRGSAVNNIVHFAKRYIRVAKFELLTNRRSRPRIIGVANRFATTIIGRLAKSMSEHRTGGGAEVVSWRASTEDEEAKLIADTISRQHAAGYRYRDIAVLVRSSTSYPRLLEAFSARAIPVQPGGRTGLFMESEAQLFGQTFAFLAGHDWRTSAYGAFGSKVQLDPLVEDYVREFGLSSARKARVRRRLADWRIEVGAGDKPANLVRDFYDLLSDCGVGAWDLNDPLRVSRLGCLARCSAILADYESIRRRARPDENAPGELVGGTDRGQYYYMWLAIHIQNWALGEFEGFEGEDGFAIDAVDLTTIHKAKGLEWPIVFVPCVSAKRFPSSKTGKPQAWYVPTELFDRARYEGTENDERRLFYVAITRARDWLSVSTHDTPKKQLVAPSPFLLHLAGGMPQYTKRLPLPPPSEHRPGDDDPLSITFSDLANYKNCGLAYRLRNSIGFQPTLSPELGYGKAVHHVMRQVAEYTRRHRQPPSAAQLNLIFDTDFYLPAASKPAHKQMKASARRLVDNYIKDHCEDLQRVWAIERPFELHLPNAIISGRADVILDEQDGHISSLAIVDYKTAADENRSYEQQLQIYTDAGRREGLDVRAAYIHDLNAGRRISVDVSRQALANTEADAISLVDRLKAKTFEPNPGPACRGCDVKAICRFAA